MLEQQFLDRTRLKPFADDRLNVSKMTIFLFDGVENAGKRRKWLPAFSPFPALFSIAFFLWDVNSLDCEVW